MIKKISAASRTVVIGLLLTLSGCITHPPSAINRPPPITQEVRGVWVATVANIDWPSKPGLSVVEQKREMIAILDRCKALNLNAVIFQVRTSCDAMYASPYEPWSYFLTGKQGQPPQPFYDPLKEWIAESHRRGLQLHAWFNPYRARQAGSSYELASTHISNLNPAISKVYGKSLWLDPGEPAAQEYTLKVMADVVRRYDIDGIHIDDYFYPYKEKGADGKILDFPDDPSWAKYQAAGGKLSRDDWRRDNINQLVHRMYTQTKAIKPWVKVGISPFGIWRPGNPPSVKGFDAYQEIYCDSKLWFQNGWVDYLTPQLYWRLNDPPKPPFEDLLKWWVSVNTRHITLAPGIIDSSVPKGESQRGRSWKLQDILDQMAAVRRTEGAQGEVHFSMKALMEDRQGMDEAMSQGLYAQTAVWPTPTVSMKAPPPQVRERQEGDGLVVSWKKGGWFSKTPSCWVVQVRYGQIWRSRMFGPDERQAVVGVDEKWGRPQAVAVTAVGRNGSQGTTVK